ncbi:MAG: TorF family putative porin [Hyphomicrobium sp.]
MTKVVNKLSLAGLAGAALFGLAAPAAADDSFWWSVNLAGSSDYMFRGVSQTDNEPAVSGGLDVGYGIFYAGVWASGVDDNFVATATEIDVYAGVKPKWGKITLDFAVLGYLYPNQDDAISLGNEVSYLELKSGVSVAVTDSFSVGATYYYSPEYSFEVGEGHTIEGTAALTLPQMWVFTPTISGTVGYLETDLPSLPGDRDGPDNDGDGVPDLQTDITYWNAGLALTVEKITFDMRYFGSDTESKLTDDRFVFQTKIVLP